jgi:hypothetical protein
MARHVSPYTNATAPGRVRRRAVPRALSLLPTEDAFAAAVPAGDGSPERRAEAAVGAAALLRDLEALVEAGLIVPELVDGEVRYAPAPDLDDAA